MDGAVKAVDKYAARCRDMLTTIEFEVRETAGYTGRSRLDTRVLDALRRVARHEFVPPAMLDYAYHNRPLGIGCGQTISQPYMVALMTDLLAPEPAQRLLEIGTGCGYQAAVLSLLVEQVCSLELIPALATSAAARLLALGYDNVEVRAGSGLACWPGGGSFDGIIVAAVGPVPQVLISQLRAGGRLVMPVGHPRGEQQLVLIEKDADGGLHRLDILPVRFVPLVG